MKSELKKVLKNMRDDSVNIKRNGSQVAAVVVSHLLADYADLIEAALAKKSGGAK